MKNEEICPCKRYCERHGNCEACKTHHKSLNKFKLTACERIKKLKKTKYIKD